MKKHTLKIIGVMLMMISVSGCNKTLDFRNAEISSGKLFENGANEPFTGKVTNLPFSKIPSESLAKFIGQFRSVRPQDKITALLSRDGIASYNQIAEGQILCDTFFEKGILNGDANCKVPGSDHPFFKVPLKLGKIDGNFVMYDLDKANLVIADAWLVNSQLDGKSTVRSSNNGAIIHMREWKYGKANGAEERYDESTGKLILKAILLDGEPNGEVLRFSNGGQTLIHRLNFINGYQDGKSEEFDPLTGKLFRTTYWKDGHRVGNVEEVTSDASPNSNLELDACVELWTQAYRKEAGNDVLITTDQISEWKTSCKEGKKPG